MNILYYLLLLICLTELLVEVCIKSEIFFTTRKYFIEKNGFLSKLLTCGYCFSFWIAFILTVIFLITNNLPIILSNSILNFISIWLLVQRGSNILHGTIDKYFDKRYDIRYNGKVIT
jgi:hypothetical protein